MLWLFWIALLGVTGIEAQDSSNSVGGGPGNANTGSFGGDNKNGGRGFGHRGRPHFRKGSHFGKGGRTGQNQGNGQATTEDEPDEEDPISSPTAGSTPVDISPDPAGVTANVSSAFPEATTALIVAASGKLSSATTAPTLVGIPYAAPSSSVNIGDLFPSLQPTPTSPQFLPSPLTTSRLTVTTSKTVFVTDSAVPIPSSVQAVEDASGSTQTTKATQASALDLAPLPAASVRPLSGGEKAGIGIGITFGVLVVIGAIVYELYRRRQMKARERLGSETGSLDDPRRSLALAGFYFSGNNPNEPKSDPEWSIESASKVSMIRAGSIKSVDSHARSASPPLPVQPDYLLPRLKPGARKEDATEVVKVGMTIPERKPTMELAGMALRSNPPVSPSAFPSPPRKDNTGVWPLVD